MQTRFLLGPSGSGKTFRCVAEVQAALKAAPEGLPLVFLAPKQATFQLERQILADPELPGYTRLNVLSFERLAELVLVGTGHPAPALLNEEGRLMVLRALLTQKRESLRLFRATARLRGFAQQLSQVLRELQRAQLTPEQLFDLGSGKDQANALGLKLQDLATMLQAYQAWLADHQLEDGDRLLSLATDALRANSRSPDESARSRLVPPRFEALWFDGFAELCPQEMAFLSVLLLCCNRATLAFNLERESLGPISWLSPWSAVGRTYLEVKDRLAQTGEIQINVEWLERDGIQTRFVANPILKHLERHWASPAPFQGVSPETLPLETCLRRVQCADPETEATVAAKEILRFVRNGGKYRDAAVIVRNLEEYFDPVRRVFTAFEIPFFLDRREPVGHHPLSELTRSALKVVALGWRTEDWFSALKTGLVHASEAGIDRLENEALARGWEGAVWLSALKIPDRPDLEEWLEPLRHELVAPFVEFATALGPRPNGRQLALGLARFWKQLGVAETLQNWSEQPMADDEAGVAAMVHLTFWDQMQEWLQNLELAFASESLSLREWLPVVEAGLACQTVGVIPSTLDQVLVGAIDRSRNPDLKLAIVLGLNESVFPASPDEPGLLTSADREQLLGLGIRLGATIRHRLAQERYLGYIACTRPRERLVLTCALRDSEDRSLNPSPFLDQIQVLFPTLPVGTEAGRSDWRRSEHVCELLGAALGAEGSSALLPALLESLPLLAQVRTQWQEYHSSASQLTLTPRLAEALYGPVLETSVSRLEEYAACPFRFALTSGLHVEERRRFKVDARHQGSFQHEILARFHQQLRQEGKRWRDLSVPEARGRIRQIAEKVMIEYEGGLLLASEQSRFVADSLITALQQFISAVIRWMPQYDFEPHAVELAFGIEEKPLPAWEIDLGAGHRLSFRGKIDRVDLWPDPRGQDALCVVMDYKSSARRLDPVLMDHGIQLQLLAYLNVLRSLEDAQRVFGVRRLVPAGVFFVNLRGQYAAGKSRSEVLEGCEVAGALAYQHTGRFDVEALRRLDNRPEAEAGDQFNYRLRQDGKVHGQCREPLENAQLVKLLDGVEAQLRRMGQEIYAGTVRVDPYRKGQVTACDRCEYRSVCRIDPWTHVFRVLQEKEAPSAKA